MSTSHVNQSEMIATFLDYDAPTSPYDGLALRLKLMADIAVFYVGTFTEGDGKDVGTETFKFDDKQSVGVDAEQLYQTLGAMLRRSDRHTYDRLVEGTLRSDHPNLRTQTMSVLVPGTRIRA